MLLFYLLIWSQHLLTCHRVFFAHFEHTFALSLKNNLVSRSNKMLFIIWFDVLIFVHSLLRHPSQVHRRLVWTVGIMLIYMYLLLNFILLGVIFHAQCYFALDIICFQRKLFVSDYNCLWILWFFHLSWYSLVNNVNNVHNVAFWRKVSDFYVVICFEFTFAV